MIKVTEELKTIEEPATIVVNGVERQVVLRRKVIRGVRAPFAPPSLPENPNFSYKGLLELKKLIEEAENGDF